MQSVENRRRFVRQMVVGVPVLAATTSFPKPVVGFSHHEEHAPSTMIESTVRDLARLHNEMQQRGVRQDDIRAITAHVRALGTHQFESNRDVELVRNIRAVIARDGRQSIIDRTPDPEMMRRELVALGFDVRTTPVAIIDPQRRADALARLERGGLAPAYFDTIFSFEEGGYVGWVGVSAAAGDLCTGLRGMHTTMESVAAVMCALAIVIPPAIPDCFAASSTLAMLKLLILLIGC
jgi:hypothetical protein